MDTVETQFTHVTELLEKHLPDQGLLDDKPINETSKSENGDTPLRHPIRAEFVQSRAEEMEILLTECHTPRESANPSKRIMNGLYDYMVSKTSKADLNAEIKQLKILYHDLLLRLKIYKDKNIEEYRNLYESIKKGFKEYFHWVVFYICGKILGFYSLYKIVMTCKNYFLSNYSDINTMLKEELINIIDKLLGIGFYILKLDNESLLYNMLEQHFSLFIVGTIIFVNMRSFLNTIYFLYTTAIKKIDSSNKTGQTLLMSYFVGMFYVTSSIFIIFSLPKTYR